METEIKEQENLIQSDNIPTNEKQIEEPKRKYLHFGSSFINGLGPGDMIEISNKQDVPIKLETFDEFSTNLKEAYGEEQMTDEKLQELYTNSQMLYALYLDGERFSNFANYKFPNIDYYKKLGYPVDEQYNLSTKRKVQSTTEMSTVGGSISMWTPDEAAFYSDYFTTKEGRMLPLKYRDVADNYLRRTQTLDGRYLIEEAPTGAFISSSDIIGNGPRKLNSNGWSSLWYGLVAGSMPTIAKGIGTGYALMTKGYYDIFHPDVKFEDTKAYENYIDIQNWSNRWMIRNVDEELGAFANWNSFLFSFGEGITQLGGIMLSSFVGAGALSAMSMGPRFFSAFSRLGATMLGGLEAGGHQADVFLDAGYEMDDFAPELYAYIAMTMAAESIFAPAEKFGGKYFTRKGISTAQQKNLAAKEIGGAQKSYGIHGTPVGQHSEVAKKSMVGKTISKFRDLGNKPYAPGKGFWKGFGRTMYAAGEESIEEGIEAVGYMMFNRYMNGVLLTMAKGTMDFYSDYTFETFESEGDVSGMFSEVPDTELYKGMTIGYKAADVKVTNNKTGEHTYISKAQFERVQKQLQTADDILSGEKLLDEDWHFEEMAMAFLTTATVFGGGNSLGLMRGSDNDLTKLKIAQMIVKDPSKREEFISSMRKLQKEEQFYGSNAVNVFGEKIDPNKPQKTEAEHRMDELIQEIDFAVEVLTNPEFDIFTDQEKQLAINNSQSIVRSGFNLASTISHIDKMIASLEKNEGIPEESIKALGITEDQLPKINIEYLKDQREKAKERFNWWTEPLNDEYVDNNKIKKRNVSEGYIAKALALLETDYHMEAIAERQAKAKIEKKMKVDDERYNERLAKEKSRILNRMKKNPAEMMNVFHTLEVSKTLGMQLNPEIFSALMHFSMTNKNSILNLHKNLIFAFAENLTKKNTQIKESFFLSPEDFQSELKTIVDEAKSLMETGDILPVQMKDDLNALKVTLDSMSFSLKLDEKNQTNIFSIQDRNAFNKVKTEIEGLFNQYKESMSLIGQVEEIDPSFENIVFKEEGGLFQQYMENENAEDVNLVSEKHGGEILEYLINDVKLSSLEGKGVNTVEQVLKSFEEISKQPDGVFDDPGSAFDIINSVLEYLQDIEQYITYNHDFFQENIEKKHKMPEYSYIVNKNTNPKEDAYNFTPTRINTQSKENALAVIKKQKQRAADLREAIKEQKTNLELETTRPMFATTNIELNIFNVLVEKHANILENSKIGKTIGGRVNKIRQLLEKSGITTKDPKTKKDVKKKYKNIEELYMDYAEAKLNDNMELAHEIFQHIMKIEKELVELKDELTGKLTDVIKEIFSKSNIRYTHTREFEKTLYGKNIKTFDGILSNDGILNSIDNFYSDNEELNKGSSASFYLYFATTMLNRVNKMGQGESPTFASLYKTLYDVVKETPEGDPIFTFEQEQIIIHALGFYFNPGNDFITNNDIDEFFKASLINNTLSIRGYGGAGKSFLFVPTMLKALHKILGRKVKLTLYVPTKELSNEHNKSLAKLTDEGIIELKLELIEDLDKFSDSEADLYMIDESSVIPGILVNENSNFFKKANEEGFKTPIFLIGDDNQTNEIISVNENLEYESKIIPAGSYHLARSGEKTMPMTYVFRSGIQQINNLVSYFRDLKVHEFTGDIPITLSKKAKKDGSGVIIGAEYAMNEASVIEGFIKRLENDPTPEEAILIVLTNQDRDRIISSRQIPKKFHNNIKTLFYDIASIKKDANNNHLISGLKSESVYFAVDFMNQKWQGKDMFFPNTNAGTSVISRLGLTAISRVSKQGYIMLVGNPDNNSEAIAQQEEDTKINTFNNEETVSQFSVNLRNELLDPNGRLKNLMGEDLKNETDKSENEVSKTDIDITLNLQEKEKEKVRKNTKPIIDKLIKNKASLKEINELKHISDIAYNLNNNEKVDESNQLNKTRNLMIRRGMEYALESNTTNLEVFLRAFDDYVEIYEKEVKKIDNIEGYKNTIINLLYVNQEMLNVLHDGIPVLSPTLRYKDNSTGEELIGQPLMLNVVGQVKSKNNKGEVIYIPIVDVYEVVYKYDKDTDIRDTKSWQTTLNKLAGYIYGLNESTIKVNNIYVNEVHVDEKNSKMSYTKMHLLDSKDLKSSYDKIVKILEISNPSEFNIGLATEKEISSNERILNHSLQGEGIILNNYYFDQGGNVIQIKEITVKNNKYYIYYKTEDGNIDRVSLDKFNNDFSIIGPVKVAMKFKSSSDAFVTEGEPLISMGHNIFYPEGTPSLDISKLTNAFSKDQNNTILKARHIVSFHINKSKGLHVKRVMFKDSLKGVWIDSKTGKMKHNHEFVNKKNGRFPVVTVIDDNLILSIIANSTELSALLNITSKTKKADKLKLFKSNGLHIIGVDSEVEIDFVSKENKRGKSIYDDKKKTKELLDFLNSSENDYRSIAKEIMSDTFMSETDEVIRQNLRNMNQRRLEIMWELYNDIDVNGTLLYTNSGNILYNENGKKISFKQLENNLKGSNVKIIRNSDNTPLIQRETFYVGDEERTRFYILAYHHDHTNAVKIYLDGKQASSKDLISFFKEIEESKEIAELIEKEAKNEIEKKVVYAYIDQTDAMQFIRHNRSLIKKHLIDEFSQMGLYLYYNEKRSSIDLRGITPKQKLENLKKAISFINETLENFEKEGITDQPTFYLTPFTEKDVSDNYNNLSTNVRGLSQPSHFVSSSSGRQNSQTVKEFTDEQIEGMEEDLENKVSDEKTDDTSIDEIPDDPEYLGHAVNLEYRINLISEQKARSELKRLIGSDHLSKVYFKNGYLDINDDGFLLGRVRNAMLELSMFNDGVSLGVDEKTTRHEAIHFILLYLVNPTMATNIMNAASEEMLRKGKIINNDVDIHEYIADKFMDGDYKAKSRLGQFIMWLKRILAKFSGRYDYLQSFFEMADNGVFANNSIQEIYSEFDLEHRVSKYVSPKRVKAAYETFHTPGMTNFVANQLVTRRIMHNSEVGPVFLPNQNFKTSIIHTISTYRNARSRLIQKQDDIQRIYDYSQTDSEGNPLLIFEGHVSEMTSEAFYLASLYKNPEKTIFMNKKMNLNNPKYSGNLKAFNDYISYHLGGSVGLTIMQMALGNINLDVARYGEISTSRGQTNITIDSHRISNKDLQSGYLNMFLRSIPLYDYSYVSSEQRTRAQKNVEQELKRKKIKKDDLNYEEIYDNLLENELQKMRMNLSNKRQKPHQFVSFEKLNGLLLDAASIIKGSGITPSLENLFATLRSQLESGTDAITADTIYSFLRLAGNVYSVEINVRNPLFKNVTKVGFQGVGMYSLITDPRFKELDKKHRLKSETYPYSESAWYEKEQAMRNILNAIWSNYFSVFNRMQTHIDRNTNEMITYSNSDVSMIKSNIKSNIRRETYYNGKLKKRYQSMIMPGIGQVIDIKDGKVYDVENGRTLILDITKKQIEPHHVKWLFKILGFKGDQEVIYPVINDLIAIERNKLINHLYYMLLAMKASVLVTNDIDSTLKGKPPVPSILPRIRKTDSEAIKESQAPKLYINSERVNIIYSDETVEILQELNKFYKKNGYNTEAVNKKYQQVYKDGAIQNAIIPMPEDMWQYIEDSIAKRMLLRSNKTYSRILKTVTGENAYEHTPSSFLMDLFGGTWNTTETVRNKIIGEINEGDKNNPLITVLSDGTIRYNSSLLRGKMKFDKLTIFNGIKGITKNVEYKKLTSKDYIKSFIDSMIIGSIVKDRSYFKLASMLDPMADKSIMPMAEWYESNYNSVFALKDIIRGQKIKNFKIEPHVLIEYFTDFINYYHELKNISSKAYQNTLKEAGTRKGKQLVEFFKHSNLQEFRDYIITKKGEVLPGNAITQKNNPYIEIDQTKWSKLNSDEKYALIKKKFENQFKNYLELLEKYEYKLPKSVDELWDITEEETYSEQFIWDENWHPILEAAFWSHHIFNESVSHIARKSMYEYEDIIDYVKRASGLVAPRTKYNSNEQIGLHKQMRVLVTTDLEDYHKQDNSRVESTDGLSILNPITRELLYRAAGGVYGNVNRGMLKNVLYNVDHKTNNLTYFKMAQMPITEIEYRNSNSMRDLTKMMLGELGNVIPADYKHLFPKLSNTEAKKTILEWLDIDFDAGIQIAADFIQSKEGKTYLNKIVDYVVFESAFKSGKRKVNTLNGKSWEDVQFDVKLNNEENVIYVPTDSLGLQTVTYQNTVQSTKNIPTQLIYTIMGFSHNELIAKSLNSSLKALTEYGLEKIPQGHDKTIKFLKNLAYENGLGHRSLKLMEIAFGKNAGINIAPDAHIQNLIKHINDYLKPSMHGNQYVQAPQSFKLFFDEKGRPYMPADIGKFDRDIDENFGAARKLDPFHYDENDQAKPAEVIIPFHYMREFGINFNMSLQESLTFNFGDESIYFYGFTPQEIKNALKGKDLIEALDNMDENQAKSITRGVPIENLKPEFLEKYFFDYLIKFNLALETIGVRIPTTGGASAFIAKVVGFHNRADNTVYVSAQKNSWDGSDYDIDALQLYFKTLDDKGIITEDGYYEAKGIAKMENIIFDTIWEFYNNKANKPLISQKIDIQSLRDRANKLDYSKYNASDIGSAIQIREFNKAGNTLVGHFANLQNAIFRFLSLESEFNKYSKSKKKAFGEFALFNNKEKALESLYFITKLINAATDNAKEGGLLGRLNITEETSPIIAGMIFLGKSEKEILDILLENEELVEKSIKADNSKSDQNTSKRLYELLEDETLKKYAYIGEQIRRFTNIISIQQGVKPTLWELKQTVNNLSLALGGNLENLFKGTESKRTFIGRTYDQQMAWVKGNDHVSLNEIHEEEIRKTFNIATIVGLSPILEEYVYAIYRVNNKIDMTFTITSNIEVKEQILKKVGATDFFYQDTFENYYKEITRAYQGKMISEIIGHINVGNNFTKDYFNKNFLKKPNEVIDYLDYYINYNGFDLSSTVGRTYFFMMFPYIVRELKNGIYKNNQFIKRTVVEQYTEKETYLIAKFEESARMDLVEKDFYKNHYDMLPEDIKELFRVYQLLRYGFSNINGSFFDLIDSKYETKFEQWIEEYPWEDFKESQQDIIARGQLGGKIKDRPMYATTRGRYGIKHTGKKKGNKEIENIEKEGKEELEESPHLTKDYTKEFYVYLYDPILTSMNGYFNTSVVGSDKVYHRLGFEDIIKLSHGETVELISYVDNGIVSAESVQFNEGEIDGRPISYQLTKLPDNSYVIIIEESANTLSIRPSKIEDNSLSEISHTAETVIPSEFVNSIVNMMHRVFPNIKMEKVDTAFLASLGHPYSNAVIHNGVLYINYERIKFSTPLHELSHIFLSIIEHYNPNLYSKLKNSAENYLDSELADRIKQKHPKLSDENVLQEIMAYIIGFNSQGMMEELMMKYGVSEVKTLASKIINSIQSFIQDIRNSIMHFIQMVFGIEFKNIENLEQMTIEEVGDYLFKALKNGKAISYISTDSFNLIKDTSIGFREETFIKSVKSLTDLYEHAVNPISKTVNVNIDRELMLLKDQIANSGGVYYDFVKNEEIEFTNVYDPINNDALLNIINNRLDNSEKTKDNIIAYYNDGGKPGKSEEYFGINFKKEKPNVSIDVLRKLNHQMSFDPVVKTMRYSDLKKDASLSFLYHEDFKGFDPVISILAQSENHIVISIHDVNTLNVKTYDKRSDKLLFKNFFKAGEAQQKRFKLTNDEMTVRKLMLALLVNKIRQENSTVSVMDVGVINFNNKDSERFLVDMPYFNKQLKILASNEEFMNLFDNEKIKRVLKGKLYDVNNDAEGIMITTYREWARDGRIDKGMFHYIREEENLSVNEKLDILNRRLLTIFERNPENDSFSIKEKREVKMILEAIKAIKLVKMADGQYNELTDLDTVSKLFDANSIGADNVQEVHRIINEASRKIVLKFNDQKKKVNVLLDKAKKLYLKEHPGANVEELVFNLSGKIFEKIFVKIPDITGNRMLNTGFIYWTDNENEAKGIAKEHAKQARKMIAEDYNFKDWLEIGRGFVEIIHETYLNSIVHHRRMSTGFNGFWDAEADKLYDTKSAQKEIDENNTHYVKGMVPLMTQSTGEMMSKGFKGVKGALGKRFIEITDLEELYDIRNRDRTHDYNDHRMIGDSFFWQFGYGKKNAPASELGVKLRTDAMLGIFKDINEGVLASGQNKVGWKILNEAKDINSKMSTNMEMIMNYFMITTIRNEVYEEEVMPAINGIKLLLRDIDENTSTEMQKTIDYINVYTEQTIKGRRNVWKGEMGEKLDKGLRLSMAVTSPMVMAFNPNIAMIGATANALFAWTEAIGNTMVKDGNLYNAADLAKASTLFFSHKRKVGQLLQQLQVMNMTERDLISFRRRQKLPKTLISSYASNWTNWATDYYARGVIMVAQMIHDGSWNAYSINPDTGLVDYDVKKDRRYYNEDGTQSKEQKALMNHKKQRLIIDGVWGQKKNDPLVSGYDLMTTRKFKALADKYVVGSYDALPKSVIAQNVLGKLFSMFNIWFISRVSNAFQKGEHIETLGDWRISHDEKGNVIYDEHGEPMVQFEKEFVEGYMRTITRYMGILLRYGKFDYKNMTSNDKRNFMKFATSVALFFIMRALYLGLVDDDKDKDKSAKLFWSKMNFDKPIPNWRLIRNVMYSYESLLVLPTAIRTINEPFAVFQILRNYIFDRNNKMSFNNYPGKAAITAFKEPLHAMYTGDIYDEDTD
jgi:hypothetical protein